MVVYWVALAFFAVVTNSSGVVMKVRVNDTLPQSERFSWWNRDARGVSRKYRQLFPDSYLPDVERYSFWLFLVMLAACVIASLQKPN
jgi:hypothetical protein